MLVSEWVDGMPLSRIIAGGTEEQRDRAGLLLARFLFSGPARAGLLHADPHPATSGCTTTAGSSCSTTARSTGCRTGCPRRSGRCCGSPSTGDAEGVLDGLRAEGFVRPGVDLDAERLLDYLAPILEPVRAETFRFSRAWLRSQAVRVGRPALTGVQHRPAAQPAAGVPADPPGHAGAIGVLCQLEAEAPWRAELEHLAARLPGPRPRKRRTRSASRHHHSGSSLLSIARTFSRLQRSQWCTRRPRSTEVLHPSGRRTQAGARHHRTGTVRRTRAVPGGRRTPGWSVDAHRSPGRC